MSQVSMVVSRAFRDKVTLQPYSVGDPYPTGDDERVEYLRGKGFLTEVADPVPDIADIVDLTGDVPDPDISVVPDKKKGKGGDLKDVPAE